MRGSRAGVVIDVTYTAVAGRPWVDASYRLTAARPLALRAFQGRGCGPARARLRQSRTMLCSRVSSGSSEASVRRARWTFRLPCARGSRPSKLGDRSEHGCGEGRAIVGLMWNPLQKWDGRRTRPAAVFASPNFVEARRNHLLGLFLPSIPDFVRANTLLAKNPYPMRRGSGAHAAGKPLCRSAV